MSTQIPPYPDESSAQRYGPGPSSGGWGPPPQRGGPKPFYLTSEFLVLVLAVVAVVIAGAVADNFDASQVWGLVTFLSVAYIISRGLSKIGSHAAGERE